MEKKCVSDPKGWDVGTFGIIISQMIPEMVVPIFSHATPFMYHIFCYWEVSEDDPKLKITNWD